MPIYILEMDDHFFSLNREAARYGFRMMGADVRIVSQAALKMLDLQHEDIVVGGIGVVRDAMRRMGLTVPSLPSLPQTLLPFAGRRIWPTTMGALRRRVDRGETLFAKPGPDRPKLFVGQLFSGFGDLVQTAHIDDAEPVDCAEPMSFLTEYRCFLVKGELADIRPYKGDPLVFPDPDTIRRALAAYSDAPQGGSVDFGVTDTGETVVVEANDGYALGAYGLSPLVYATLIQARWDEIKRSG